MRPDSTNCPVCQSRFGDSQTVHFANRGPNDPYYPEYILDDADGQLAECGPNGFGIFLPTWMSDPPSVSVYHPVSQPIGFDVVQVLIFNQEHYDTDSMHDNEKDSSRITFNTAGVYVVTFNLTWGRIDAAAGDYGAAIRKNTGDYITSDNGDYGDSDAFHAQSLSYQGFFEPGEYVEALAKQDAEDADGEPMVNRIITERYSPAFAATFLRLEP